MKKVFVLSNGSVVMGVVSDSDELGDLAAMTGEGLWLTEASVGGVKLAWLFVPKTQVIAEGEVRAPDEVVTPQSYSQSF